MTLFCMACVTVLLLLTSLAEGQWLLFHSHPVISSAAASGCLIQALLPSLLHSEIPMRGLLREGCHVRHCEPFSGCRGFRYLGADTTSPAAARRWESAPVVRRRAVSGRAASPFPAAPGDMLLASGLPWCHGPRHLPSLFRVRRRQCERLSFLPVHLEGGPVGAVPCSL